MKYDLNFFLRKTQFALMAALGVLPLVLVIAAFVAPALLTNMWLLMLLYLVLAVSAMLLPGKLRVWLGLLEAVCLVLLWMWLYPGERRWVSGVCAGAFSVLHLWGLRFGGMGQEDELPAYVTWIGTALHIAAQALAAIGSTLGFAQLDPALPMLTGSMAAFVFLAVLAANRRSLLKASTGRQEVPTAMRRRNLLMTVGVFAVAVVLSFSSWVSKRIRFVIAWALEMLMYLLMGVEDLPQATEPVQTVPPTTTEDLGQLPPAPQAQTPMWLITVFQLLGIAVTIVLICIFIRKMLATFPGVKAALKKHLSASSEDYVDEVSNTRQGGIVDQLRSLRKKREDNVRESRLPPRQRIRARYRKLLKKHPQWTSGHTARENLPEELASVYERARYSDHPITEEEAEKFRQDAKKL